MSKPNNEAIKAAKVLGRLGTSNGGKARAASLRPEERSEIARRAVQARWEKAELESATSETEAVLRATMVVRGDRSRSEKSKSRAMSSRTEGACSPRRGCFAPLESAAAEGGQAWPIPLRKRH